MAITLFIIGAIFIVLELVVNGIMLVFFGVGFITASMLVFLGVNYGITTLISMAVTILSIVFIRKPILNQLKVEDTKSGSDSLIGKTGKVTKELTAKPGTMGEVVVSGVTWNATSEEPIGLDEVVEIVNVLGAHVEVKEMKEV